MTFFNGHIQTIPIRSKSYVYSSFNLLENYMHHERSYISNDSFKNRRIKTSCHFVFGLLSLKQADVICTSCLKPWFELVSTCGTHHTHILFMGSSQFNSIPFGYTLHLELTLPYMETLSILSDSLFFHVPFYRQIHHHKQICLWRVTVILISKIKWQ